MSRSRQKAIAAFVRNFADNPHHKDVGDLAIDRYAQLEKDNRNNPQQKSAITATGSLISYEQADAFYKSEEWQQLKASVYQKYGYCCMACGETQVAMRVDHIKPLRRYWELRLDFDNMQVLCIGCNKNKGNWTEIDYRPQAKYIKKYRRKGELSHETEVNVFMQQKTNLALRRKK